MAPRARTSSVAGLALALATLATGALALPLRHAGPAGATVAPLTVVSVGDSFASGEGAIGGGWLPDGGNGCHRSPIGGHQLAANRFTGAVFTPLACSGAETGAPGKPLPDAAHRLLGPGGQLSLAVPTPGTAVDALTLSIGGNDLDFANVVASCALPYECYLDPAVTGGLAANLARLPAALGAVTMALQGPTKSVPGTVRHVFVTEYPDPTTGVFGLRCGLPLAEPFQGFDFISPAEAEWASTAVVAPLNAALATMVATANAVRGPTDPVWHFVSDVDDRFATHGYCTGIDGTEILTNPWWWTRPRNANPRFISTLVDSLTSQGDYLGAMHPNDLGQGQIADALEGAIDFLRHAQVVTVSPSANPMAGVPVTLAVQVTDEGGRGVPDAPVWAGPNFLGWTDATGALSATTTFATAGSVAVTADGNPYPAGTTWLAVASASYTVTSTPNPVPMNTTLSNVVFDAVDATGQRVAGTFRLHHGGGYVSRAAGQAFATLRITPLLKKEPGDDGGTITVPECPELTFTPASAAFTASDASFLVACPY